MNLTVISAGAQIAILSGLTAILLAVGVWIALRIHWTPERREKKRRLEVHHHGRLGDAMVTEATEETVYYSYSVRGVQYTACFGDYSVPVPGRLEWSRCGIPDRPG